MNKTIVALGILFVLNPVIDLTCIAATIEATSCTQTHVQSAINSARSGDRVLVPPGQCTWTQPVDIPDEKKIELIGAGTDATIITVDMLLDPAIYANFSGARISGFGFYFSKITGGINVRGSGWRIDHCRFDNPSSAATVEGIFANGSSSNDVLNGLVDHCELINSKVLVVGNLALLAHKIWARPLSLGTDKAVYVEDCIFRFTKTGNCMDANYGGAYVFRYNTIIDTYVEAHSVQGDERATRKWEIYNNTFKQVNMAMWVPMFLRGGTGVVFNNTLTGEWSDPRIALDNVRDCESREIAGKCDGSSPWDGNQPGGSGYPCRDQIGRSTDNYLWTDKTPYPPQALDPAYAWNNRLGGTDVPFFQHNNCANHIQPGRDYYNGTVKPGYTPYTYPHPQVQGWSPSTVSPPTNLRVVEWTQ